MSKLLTRVRKVHTYVLEFSTGRLCQYRKTKKIAENIMQNEIPKFWRKCTVPDSAILSTKIEQMEQERTRTDQRDVHPPAETQIHLVKCAPTNIKRLEKNEMLVPLYLNSTRRNLSCRSNWTYPSPPSPRSCCIRGVLP